MNRIRSTVSPERSGVRWAVFALIGCALAAVSGRLAVHTVNDTASYLNYPFGSWTAALLSTRTPGYPAFLALVGPTLGLASVPILQVLLHATASWSLAEELLRRGMPKRPSLMAAFCVLVGCTATDHIQTLSTDAPAASLGVLTAVLLLRTVRSGFKLDATICAALAILTIAVRPAYLFLIVWLAVAGWMIARRDSQRSPERIHRPQPWIGLKISLAVSLVVIGWMGLRRAVVGEFGIATFGHQNLSAVLVQLVPPETLRRLPGDAGNLGRLVADELQDQSLELPTGAGNLPTLTIESQWGQINYGVVWPTAKQNLSRRWDTSSAEETNRSASDSRAEAVRVHEWIGSMNVAILRAAPLRFIRWLLLAVRRAVWGGAADILMHPIFLAMILFATLRLLARSCRGRPLGPIRVPAGWGSLAILAITYAIFNLGFVILSSPPIGRFTDAGAIFLPGLLASLLVAQRPENAPATASVTSPR